ncbi:helix-turn-helix domain-containing protein [bacterium]|nr:helix-turn-helix domain-containing protein [bacterium]
MNPERTIGETLRIAREGKALTLEEVRDKTRIALSVLHALERDRFSELPGPIYVKNHIRVLSELLNLDRDSLLERYEEAVTGEKAQPAEEAVWSEENVREVRFSGWRPGRLFWIVTIAVVAIGLFIIWAPWKYFGRSEGVTPVSIENDAPAETVSLPALPLEDFPFLPEGYDVSDLSQNEQSIMLRIEAGGNARVIVNVDDRRNIFRDLEAGSVWVLEGEEYFYFSAIDLDKLTLSLDGEALILPEAPGGEISGYRIDAASVGRVQ